MKQTGTPYLAHKIYGGLETFWTALHLPFLMIRLCFPFPEERGKRFPEEKDFAPHLKQDISPQ